MRHKILGCKFGATPTAWANTYKKDFFGLGAYPSGWNPQKVREDDLVACLGMMSLHHLGYAVPVEPQDWLNRGFDVAIDYFCGEWWKGDEDAESSMDKSRRTRRQLRWFNAFSRGLLLGLLSERWKELESVCAWVEPDLKAEPLRLDVDEEVTEPELSAAYISIAASLGPNPKPDLGALEKRLKACKKPRPKLLFRAWEAARAGDQPTFEGAFLESLAQYAATSGVRRTPFHWIAPHQSVVGLAAVRLGLELPPLPPTFEAVIISPSSLGFESVQRPKNQPHHTSSIDLLFDNPKNFENEEAQISSRQLAFTLRGLMRAKAKLARDGESLDRNLAEAWFIEHASIERYFKDHGHFARALDLALEIHHGKE